MNVKYMYFKYIKTKINIDNISFPYKIIEIISQNYIKQSLLHKCFSYYVKKFETNLNCKNFIIFIVYLFKVFILMVLISIKKMYTFI